MDLAGGAPVDLDEPAARGGEVTSRGDVPPFARALTEQGAAVLGLQDGELGLYVAAVDPQTLKPVDTVNAPTVLAIAARVGNLRLIDNVIIG